jgi:hypothetical protein
MVISKDGPASVESLSPKRNSFELVRLYTAQIIEVVTPIIGYEITIQD